MAPDGTTNSWSPQTPDAAAPDSHPWLPNIITIMLCLYIPPSSHLMAFMAKSKHKHIKVNTWYKYNIKVRKRRVRWRYLSRSASSPSRCICILPPTGVLALVGFLHFSLHISDLRAENMTRRGDLKPFEVVFLLSHHTGPRHGDTIRDMRDEHGTATRSYISWYRVKEYTLSIERPRAI